MSSGLGTTRAMCPLTGAPCAALDALAETVAARITERLLPEVRRPSTLVDAAELARHLGTSSEFVYRHADALGAVRLGDGPRPRLRFDLASAQASASARVENKQSSGPRRPRRRRSRPPSAGTTRAGNPLLPVPRDGI
jgi:hypothetical protein